MIGRWATLRAPRWDFPIIEVRYPADFSFDGSIVIRKSTPLVEFKSFGLC